MSGVGRGAQLGTGQYRGTSVRRIGVVAWLRAIVLTIALVGAQTGGWAFSPTAVAGPIGPATTVPYRTQPPPSGGVVWQDRLDTAPPGQLTVQTGDSLFAPTADTTDDSTYVHGSIEADPAGGKVLHHTIPAGALGNFTVSPRLTREVEHALLEYDIRFDNNFDWRWGGKMPGLVGVAPDVSIYAPTSGRPNRDVGFSTRLMWHGRGDDGSRPFQSSLGPIPSGQDNTTVAYIYARKPSAGFDGFGWQANLGSELRRGAWHTMKMEVKLNTVGQADGIYRVWIDGNLRFSASDWDYRDRSDVMIQAVLYDVHRGGDSDRNWVSSRDTYVDVRNIVVTEVR